MAWLLVIPVGNLLILFGLPILLQTKSLHPAIQQRAFLLEEHLIETEVKAIDAMDHWIGQAYGGRNVAAESPALTAFDDQLDDNERILLGRGEELTPGERYLNGCAVLSDTPLVLIPVALACAFSLTVVVVVVASAVSNHVFAWHQRIRHNTLYTSVLFVVIITPLVAYSISLYLYFR